MMRFAVATRRGFVLLVVLIMTGSALLVATGLLYMSSADGAAGVVHRRDAQSRALAWSGLQVLMQQLSEQRESILAGASPELDEQYEMYEASNRIGVIRLLPIQGGARLISEAGKLDLNVVKADALVATGLLEPELAEAIVAYRDASPDRPIQSVAELLNVEGVTPELLYGPLDEWRVAPDVVTEEDSVGERIASRLDRTPVKGLADVVTVYGFEPSLQSNGVRRIQLNLDWDEQLRQRCADRFGSLAGQVQSLFQNGSIKTDADLVGAILRQSVPEEDQSRLLDTFTAEDGDYRFGRLDINTAPYETLMSLEGIEPSQAEQIIRVRDQLSDDERITIAWLTQRQIMDATQLEAISNHVTTRSFTWRVRIAAGEVDDSNTDGPILNPLLFEAVFDVSESRPRLAYLREITLLQTTAQLVASGVLSYDNTRQYEGDMQDGPSYEDTLNSPSIADDELESNDPPPDADFDSTGPNMTRDTKQESSSSSSPSRVGRWKTGDS
ncbi:MAG: helix-hairpin-helix domain-containing protein [Planctomycetota bacterium]|nr:helix-hairpin-helix domain-containing protein [Planctomycetota bacterium]